MAIRRCRFCHAVLQGDPEQLGARCPECRRALYERSASSPPEAEVIDPDLCSLHTTALAVSTCQRCGNFYCDVCRTTWQGRVMCLACVERALEIGDASPDVTQAHRRQAFLGVLFGTIAWLFAMLILIILGTGNNATKVTMVGSCVFLALFGFGSAAAGLGQAAAAIRTRGDRLVVATVGMVLSGLYLGMLLGYFGASLWQD